MSIRYLVCLVVALVLMFATTASAQGVVSLNKASAAEIQAISSKIPESLAKDIVSYREKNGPFKKADDLLKVPGMTQDFFETINPIEMDGDLVHDPDAEPLPMGSFPGPPPGPPGRRPSSLTPSVPPDAKACPARRPRVEEPQGVNGQGLPSIPCSPPPPGLQPAWSLCFLGPG